MKKKQKSKALTVKKIKATKKLPIQAYSNSGVPSHDAANLHDRAMADWWPRQLPADADILPDLDTIVSRSRDLIRNNGLASGGIQSLKDNIIGAQLKLQAMPDYKLLGKTKEWADEWAENTESQFRTWAETMECDAANSQTFIGIALQVLGSAFFNGESLIIPIWQQRNGAKWSTRIMTIDADRLSTPNDMAGQENIRDGIKIDKYGAPKRYYIRNDVQRYNYYNNTGIYGFGYPEWESIAAFTSWGRRKVIHLYDKGRAGQSKGVPLLTAIMKDFHVLDLYAKNELQASASNALIAAFIESTMDQMSVSELFGETPEDKRNTWGEVNDAYGVKLRPGAVLPLPLGAKVSGFMPNRPNNAFEAFYRAFLKSMAAGMNIPYEILAKDFSNTNYSSARAALLEAWRYFTGRRKWFQDNFLNPVYALWIEEAVDKGLVEAFDYYQNSYAYLRCKWIFSGRGWVDQTKEAEAAEKRLQIGISTLQQENAEQGNDWRETIEQRATELKYEKETFEAQGLPWPPLYRENVTVRQTIDQSDSESNEGEENAA